MVGRKLEGSGAGVVQIDLVHEFLASVLVAEVVAGIELTWVDLDDSEVQDSVLKISEKWTSG